MRELRCLTAVALLSQLVLECVAFAAGLLFDTFDAVNGRLRAFVGVFGASLSAAGVLFGALRLLARLLALALGSFPCALRVAGLSERVVAVAFGALSTRDREIPLLHGVLGAALGLLSVRGCLGAGGLRCGLRGCGGFGARDRVLDGTLRLLRARSRP